LACSRNADCLNKLAAIPDKSRGQTSCWRRGGATRTFMISEIMHRPAKALPISESGAGWRVLKYRLGGRRGLQQRPGKQPPAVRRAEAVADSSAGLPIDDLLVAAWPRFDSFAGGQHIDVGHFGILTRLRILKSIRERLRVSGNS